MSVRVGEFRSTVGSPRRDALAQDAKRGGGKDEAERKRWFPGAL